MTHTPPTLFSISVLLISFLFFFLSFFCPHGQGEGHDAYCHPVRFFRVRGMMHMAILSASPADTMFQPRATFMMVTVLGHDIAVVSRLVQIGHSFNVNELLIQYK